MDIDFKNAITTLQALKGEEKDNQSFQNAADIVIKDIEKSMEEMRMEMPSEGIYNIRRARLTVLLMEKVTSNQSNEEAYSTVIDVVMSKIRQSDYDELVTLKEVLKNTVKDFANNPVVMNKYQLLIELIDESLEDARVNIALSNVEYPLYIANRFNEILLEAKQTEMQDGVLNRRIKAQFSFLGGEENAKNQRK